MCTLQKFTAVVFFVFIFGMDISASLPLRKRRSIPKDLEAPIEVKEKDFGLTDVYGARPKYLMSWPRNKKRVDGLVRAGRSKRDKMDISQFYGRLPIE